MMKSVKSVKSFFTKSTQNWLSMIFISNVLQTCVFYIFADDVIFQLQRLNAIRQLIKRNQTSVFNIIAKTDVQTFDESGWIK